MNRNNSLLYLITVLLIANLCGTFWLIAKTFSESPHTVSENKTIEKSELIKEFDKAVVKFNSDNTEALWDMFGDYVNLPILVP